MNIKNDTTAALAKLLEGVIQTADSDPEHAHACRDAMYQKALQAIATNSSLRGKRRWSAKDCGDVARVALLAADVKLKWEATA